MSKPASKRAEDLWKRLLSWYGARLGDQFGARPPADWCATVDDATPAVIERALADIKIKHPLHPPTYPQFAECVSRLSYAQVRGPSDHERLHDFVVSHRTLTRAQLLAHWHYRFIDNAHCVCVDIPEDGDVPGFRVRLADLPDHA
jgi:hypothetical protein